MFDKIILCMCVTTSITEIAAYWKKDNKISTLKLTYLWKKKECFFFINLINLLNIFPYFPFFSWKKMGKFKVSKKVRSILEAVAIKYSCLEAAPV